MRFVAGRGAMAELLLARGAVAECHREETVARESHREAVAGRGVAAGLHREEAAAKAATLVSAPNNSYLCSTRWPGAPASRVLSHPWENTPLVWRRTTGE